jgi:hypothetical protein
MKRLLIFIILCSLSLDYTMAQPGIGLINTEIKGSLGTGRKILMSYDSSLINKVDSTRVAKSDQTVCPTLTQPNKDSIKSVELSQQTPLRKIGKVDKLKSMVKDFLKRTLVLVLFIRNIT